VCDTTLPGNGEDESQTSVGNTSKLTSNKNPDLLSTELAVNLNKCLATLVMLACQNQRKQPGKATMLDFKPMIMQFKL
jgi:hypothetical protein